MVSKGVVNMATWKVQNCSQSLKWISAGGLRLVGENAELFHPMEIEYTIDQIKTQATFTRMFPPVEKILRPFCNLQVSFHQYMIVKDVMVRESHRNKFLRLKDAKALIKMDPSKIQRIYNYLVDCRWVSTPNTSTPNTPGSSTKSINGVVR